MPIPRAKRGLWSVLVASHLYDVLASLCALIGGVLASYRLYTEQTAPAAIGAAGAILGVCVCAMLRAVFSYRSHVKNESLHELHGCLQVLHAVLAVPGEPEDAVRARLRVTIHIEQNQRLQQVLDYVGDSRDGRTAGRTFPVQCGVAGLAFRTGETRQASRTGSDHESYIEQLVHDWGYTKEEARALNPETLSRIATPVRVAGAIEGVLYLDACDRHFFVEWRRRIVENGAAGIASFVEARYERR